MPLEAYAEYGQVVAVAALEEKGHLAEILYSKLRRWPESRSARIVSCGFGVAPRALAHGILGRSVRSRTGNRDGRDSRARRENI